MPMFNRNKIATEQGTINGAKRSGDVEWNVVIVGKNRQIVSSNLIGRISIYSDSVGSGDNQINLSARH